ncbi:MAG TPA: RRXRR domain-containing protein, partial [Fervidobacterium sp.]|nr:RRXRR domain-containing protein [Fervidobacterium sp.]
FSAVTEKEELICGEVKLRDDISELLKERRMYRRIRRSRLRYRKRRFDNRISTKKEGWLAPSIKHKLDSHAIHPPHT